MRACTVVGNDLGFLHAHPTQDPDQVPREPQHRGPEIPAGLEQARELFLHWRPIISFVQTYSFLSPPGPVQEPSGQGAPL